MLGGAAALVGAIAIGPRIGRFSTVDGKRVPNDINGHSMPLCVLGVFILWFGWYGFNPGSTGEFRNMKTAARVAVTTTMSACAGGLCTLITSVLHGHPPRVAPCLNGVLAGLVGITAACDVVEPYIAIVIGFVSGDVYYYSSALLVRLGVDDPLDASPVHFFAGAWGVISVGFFASEDIQGPDPAVENGIFYGGNGKLLGVQLAGVAAIGLWSLGLSVLMFGTLKYFKILRVSVEDEIAGLDRSHHGGSAYYGESEFQVHAVQQVPQPGTEEVKALMTGPVAEGKDRMAARGCELPGIAWA
mmetsp:Transcript_37636/g.89394  ORF Transcript_37636/g.89394 Transcript_37636/m.89394 type:complete len:301 (-) Transcript_37636:184-1086(-)